MTTFKDDFQEKFKADFGFDAPKRTNKICEKPVFYDQYFHRIAWMKREHFGSPGDRDENGLPGWVADQVCTGCGRKFKSGFFADKNSALNQPD